MTGAAIAWAAAAAAGLGLAWLVHLLTRSWGRWRFLPGCLVLAWSLTPFRFDGEHDAPAFAVVIFRAFLEDGLDPEPPAVALGVVTLTVVAVYLAGVIAWVGSRRRPFPGRAS